MAKGFTNLEKENLIKLKYLQNILKDYPKNKTARLCLHRAIGLIIKPKK
jgi:hypothetical protein